MWNRSPEMKVVDTPAASTIIAGWKIGSGASPSLSSSKDERPCPME